MSQKSTMSFDQQFLDSLPTEPVLAILAVVKALRNFWDRLPGGAHGEHYEFFVEAIAIVQALAENVTDLAIPTIDLRGSKLDIARSANHYCIEVETLIASHLLELKKAQFNNKYRAKFGNAFAYEFSEGDLQRIQSLVNSLRNQISESDLFDPDHKRRVLMRLEKVQSELHKKMSDLDRFWGLIGDAGIAVGKFGNNAKPIVERIREITEIVWRTQIRAEELPSDTPLKMLSHKDEVIHKTK